MLSVSTIIYVSVCVSASAHHSLAVCMYLCVCVCARVCVCVSVCVGCSHPCVWSSHRAVQLWLWLYDGHLEAKLVNGASKPTASRPSPCWAERGVYVCVCVWQGVGWSVVVGGLYIWPAVLPQTNTPAGHLGAFPIQILLFFCFILSVLSKQNQICCAQTGEKLLPFRL